MLDRCVLDRAVGSSMKCELYLIDQGRQNFFWQGQSTVLFLALWVYHFSPIAQCWHCSVEAAIDDM